MATVGDAGSDPVRVERLADFINAPDWREKRRLAEQDAVLVSGEASRLLDGWIGQVESQGDTESAEDLRRYADILTLMRTQSVSTAFEALAESAARDGAEALQLFHDSCTTDEARDALDEAIASFARALAATGRPRCAAWLSNAGLAHSERFDLTGDVEDLHLAVDLARRAVRDTDPGDPARAGCLVNLAVYLLDRHAEGAGDGDDLAAADDAARQAVDEARRSTDPASTDHLAAAWLARARVAVARFDQAPDRARVEDAVAAARAALEVTTTDRDRAACAGTLGSALLRRYALNSDADDLDAAIVQQGRALELTASPSARPTRLSNLGTGLLTRYDRSGDIGDIDAAIGFLEQASELTPETASIAGAVSTNLGLVFAERYERRRAGSDLDRAVAAFRRAVELTPDRAVQRPSTLLNLAGGLIDEYERHGRRADLDDAVDRLAEGLASLSPRSPDAAAFHNRLSIALRHRADFERRVGLDGGADLDRAVDAARLAVEVTAPDSSLMPGWLDGLAAVLRARCDVTGAERDRREASDVARRAAEQGMRTDPATALRAALAWQSWTLPRSTWDVAADATRLAVAALRTLVSTQLMRGDKETWLRDAEGLAGRAALALTKAGDARAAVVAADTCRGVLLDEALQAGEAHVSRLRDGGHVDLVIRLQEALARTRGALQG